MSTTFLQRGLVVAALFSLSSARPATLLDVDLDAGTATSKVGPAAIGQSSSDFWNFYTRDDGHGGWLTSGAVPNLNYADGSSTSIGLQVLNCPGAWGNGSSDPMYAGYIYPFGGNATLNLTNMPAGVYDFYIYGPDGIYEVSAGAQSFGSKATANAATVNPIVWQEGVQYVVMRGVPLTAGQTATITVGPGASGYATISGFQVLSASGTPPAITTQPASASAPIGSNVTFTVTASGTLPLTYRWRFNAAAIGATGPSLTLSDLQTNQSGPYSVVISNNYGAVTSLDATLTVYRVNHAPSATPRSVVVNHDQSATITLSGSDPDGDPLTYSVASAPSHGALSGTAPNLSYQPNSGFSGSDTFTFIANDGETNSAPATISLNVLADSTFTLVNVDCGAGPVSAGSPKAGPAAAGRGTNDFWNFYSRDDAAGNWMTFGALTGLKTSDGTVTAAGLTVANAPGAWGNGSDDLMYQGYIYPFDGGNVTVTVTNLPATQYDFYVYGIDSSYRLTSGGAVYGTQPLSGTPVTNPTVWHEGLQYVVFRNVQVQASQPVILTVTPGAGGYATLSGFQISGTTPTNHPPVANSQNVSVPQGSSKSITLTGSDLDGDSLTYTLTGSPSHGSLTGTPPNLSYTPNADFSGADSFTFKVNDGHEDSDDAVVSISVLSSSARLLVDVDFGASSSPGVTGGKAGLAATGHGASDFWNFYDRNDGHGGWRSFGALANLETAEGASTLAGLTVDNAPGAWGNGSDDPMYNSYIYPFGGGNATVTVTSLDPGAYDLYIYGIDANYEVTVNGGSYGIKSLPGGPISNPVVWQENLQYVLFHTVRITSGDTLVITVRPGSSGYASIAGLQIAQVDAPPPVAPTITQQPASQTVPEGSDVTFTAQASGTSPLTWQWRRNGSDITGANSPSLTLHQVTAAKDGNYSVRVSNTSGPAVSDDATLTVTPVNHPPTANSQAVVTSLNQGTDVTLSGSDPDGDPLAFIITSPPAHGTLSGTAPNLHYQPNTDFSGPDSISFKVNDSRVDSGVAAVSITVLADASHALIDVDFGAGQSPGLGQGKVGPAATGHSTDDFWNFYTRDDAYGNYMSSGALANLKFSDQTVSGAGLAVNNAPGAWGNGSDDPMYNSYIYPFDGGNVTVTVTNLPPGQYDVYVYGIDSSYQLNSGTGSYGTHALPNGPFSNPVVWQEGQQFVVFRNVQVSASQPVILTVHPGSGGYATISGMQIAGVTASNHPPTANPQNTSLAEDTAAAISLTGSDLDGDALTYEVTILPTHGTLSGTAPNLNYAPVSGYVGPDSFAFKVNDGQSDSDEATIHLTVFSTNSQGLIDVDFGADPTTEVGPAAIGQSPSDFWNFYDRNDGNGGWRTFGSLSNLKFADGTVSGAGLTVANAPGAWGNGSSDPMYASYIYPFSGNATITITNLPIGSFDLYVYGPDGNYQVSVGTTDYGTKATANQAASNPIVWHENEQYVVFHGVQISNGADEVVLTVQPGQSGYATLSGLQISAGGAGGSTPPSNSPPTASARVQQPMPPLPGDTNLFVVSANGSNAPVILDASGSSDPDHDALTYAWFEGSLTPFATGAVVTNFMSVGMHYVTLAASDGHSISTRALQFEVISVSDAVAELAGGVERSDLSRANKRQLEAVLLGNTGNSAVENLQAFKNKISNYVAPVSPASAAVLSGAAQHIMEAEGNP